MTEKPQIFLSYAREDEKQVKELYQKLTDAGFNPWMDKENILPGQDWAYCITKAIQESDFVLVCLSTNSVNKRGYLQKEIERALDLRKEKLESDIYLIPVRLQACDVPERLKPLQWVDLFERDGAEKLMKAIQAGIQQRTHETKLPDSLPTNTSALVEHSGQISAMKTVLKPGQVVRGETYKRHYLVEQFLNSDAQGEMYRCNCEGKPIELKWYFRHSASQKKRETLESLIEHGTPSEKFLWPAEIVSAWNVPGAGYVMSLPEPRYRAFAELMTRHIDPSFRALVTAGFQLADNFLHLHHKGLCYREVSFENILFDPVTGDILLCANDNMMIDNGGRATGGLLGTPRFMAPEIVRGEAAPSMQTDLYSLAVILFHLFMLHHPLEGKKEAIVDALDLPEMARLSRLYGTDPLFIFDPNDDSNRPMPEYHRNALIFWPLYPQFLRDRFTEAFTDGIHDPQNGRVREIVWRDDMLRLRDSIVYCSHCSCENFYDPDNISKFGKTLVASCWNCKNQLQLPTSNKIKLPGGKLANRPLHFIWIIDCAATMGIEGKIEAVNNAIREAIPHMRQVAQDNPNAEMLIRAIKFSRGAEWHIAEPTPIESFQWKDLSANGFYRDMGTALGMVAEQLQSPPMPSRALPPVLVLLTDGSPTDDFDGGLQVLMNQPWGQNAVRLGIALGKKDADHKALQKFIGNPKLRPLQASNADAIVAYIKWASITVPVPEKTPFW